MLRTLAPLLAALLTVTSTVSASVAYLCLMDGGLHAECCCSPPKPPAEDRVEQARDNACCVLRTFAASHPPARAEASGEHVLPPAVAAAPQAATAVLRACQPVARRPEARGPPPRGAPSLFIQHCSFLI